jgi:hypothetical protein
LAGASDEWKERMLEAVRDTARQYEKLSSNHVMRLARERGIPEHTEMRAMGGIMKKAATNGWIEPTKTMPTHEPGDNPMCHKNPKALWDSLIYEPWS